MRTLCAVLTLVAAVAVCSRHQTQAQGVGTRLAERVQDLQITDAQEAKIAEIRKEYRPKIVKDARELATLVKDEMEKVHALLTPQQRTQLQAMKDERKEMKFERLCERLAHLKELDLTDAEVAKMQDIRKEVRPRMAKALAQLEGLLTPAQLQAREEALKEGKPRREILRSMKLNDEQRQKVEAVGKELCGLVHDEMRQIHDVLTESQKEKLAVLKDEVKDRVRDRMAHRIMTFRELNLTDAQKTALTNIRQEFRPRIHEAGNNLRAAVREEVQAIVAVLKQ
jgi:Spy/CpxP family protein refolding chaperone